MFDYRRVAAIVNNYTGRSERLIDSDQFEWDNQSVNFGDKFKDLLHTFCDIMRY